MTMLDQAVFLRDFELLNEFRRKSKSWAMSHVIFVITTTFLLIPTLYQDYRSYLEKLEEEIETGEEPTYSQEMGAPNSSAEMYIKIIFCKWCLNLQLPFPDKNI